MSQMQGQSFVTNNKTSYWPGHVVAERLVDDNDANDSISEDGVTSKLSKQQHAKSRNSSSGSSRRFSQSSRQNSQLSGLGVETKPKDFNNNNSEAAGAGSSHGDSQKKATPTNRSRTLKIKPGYCLSIVLI